MKKAGILINPNSGRGNGLGLALAERFGHNKNVILSVLQDFSDLLPNLYEMAKHDVTDLFISSGDGTVHAVQTMLAEKAIFKTLPRLCLLPHGTTNLTAADIGFRQTKITAQVDFINALAFSDLRIRPTIRVLNAKDGIIRHGMSLGSGAAAAATRYAQIAFNDRGVKGNFANFAIIAGGIAKTMLLPTNNNDPTRFDNPHEIAVHHNGITICQGPQLMTISTTLEKLFFNTKPFWGGKTGAIRTSIFPYPVPNLLRWLKPMLYGDERRKVPSGAISFSADQFEIAAAEPFVIDGEFFEGPAQGLLKVETGPAFTYICA